MLLAQTSSVDWTTTGVVSVLNFLAVGAAVFVGYHPIRALVLRQEQEYDAVLRSKLLLGVRPRTMTVLSGIVVVLLGALGYAITTSLIGVTAGLALGAATPSLAMRLLRRRRLTKLENQLVGGIQTLASGVRAGLNLIQAMQLLARDAPAPIRQEFAHLLQEYEYGMPLEQAMNNAASRIGSTDYRLLFSALQTHRERGGNLGETLDRIGESINEIQRLENRIKTLTAQGRANSRFLGGLVVFVLLVLYLIEPEGVRMLFVDDLGKMILAAIVVLNILGFLWIKRIVAIDI